ncbi:ferritin-like domain-containing protein [Conexibacter stalactiti]|uniref:Ferritin-like domain-containing protein n=1 Tax=Conexibacter stalactiti TaxID=1940611 RepID=A0ABU4HZM9_9ACTN|nr:ferritin-like domain-containing protein [Conexibacter stalactiti]MDW5598665.1 ferritin-like domain-containing protein [Conexibacter stalactiti]MEC5039307.1 ferritin-like domain-containing protein [Conexibacter stalactiti]
MTPLDRLLPFDRDGALAETFTRLQLLRGTAAVLGGAAVGAALAAGSASAASAAGDIAILDYALTLEELQAAFYSEAEHAGALDGALARQATVVGAHERAHVVALRRVLGGHASARPAFDFRGVTERPEQFRETAVAFEDLAVAVYKHEAPRIASREYLAAAIAIHSVEARHAAWIRRLAGILPAAHAFDEPLARARAMELVSSTGFIVARARTEGRSAPRFTG